MKKITMLLAVMLLSANAMAEDQVVIRFSHVVKKGAPKDLVVEKFKSLVEKYSEGKVRVENYPDSSLFGDREEMKAVKEGKVEMIAPSLSKTDQLYADKTKNPYVVLDVPFLFDTPEHVKKLAGSPVLADMAGTVTGQGVQIIGIWDNGLKQLSMNSPVENINDLEGKKIRIQPSGILKAGLKGWGATARPLSDAEVYNGMLYLTLDGAENPASNFYASRFYEVQKYMYNTNHGYLGYGWIVNDKFWNSMKPEIKAAVTKAVEETNKAQNDIATLSNEFAMQDIMGTGLTRVLEPSSELINDMKARSVSAEKALSDTQKEWLKKLKASLK